MTNTFYIAHHRTVGGDWYMLIVRDTHFCLSCGSDLDRIVTALRRCVKRTRTKERLMRELRGLECGGTISPATFDQREVWYREHGKDFFDLVHSTVEEALKEAREEDKENSPLRKTQSRLKRAGKISPLAKTIEESPKEDLPPEKDSPKILRKPRVFKHK